MTRLELPVCHLDQPTRHQTRLTPLPRVSNAQSYLFSTQKCFQPGETASEPIPTTLNKLYSSPLPTCPFSGESTGHKARRPVVVGFLKNNWSDSVPIVCERFLEQKLVTSSRLGNIAPQDSHDDSSRKSMYSCALSSPRSRDRLKYSRASSSFCSR